MKIKVFGATNSEDLERMVNDFAWIRQFRILNISLCM